MWGYFLEITTYRHINTHMYEERPALTQLMKKTDIALLQETPLICNIVIKLRDNLDPVCS